MRLDGRFGAFGGAYVPEILMPALEQLEAAFLDSREDAVFAAELGGLLATYAGRPTPLTLCRNLSTERARIYLKREDLLHGGAHKTNQVLGQALLARRMGKTRLIAETGAGQHGVATALAGALFGLKTRIYMGAHDVEIWAACGVGAELPERIGADRLLFDTVSGGRSGGTGRVFDWGRVERRPDLSRSLLAGGLNPGNARAAARLGAWALDVGSGVEVTPGHKDPARLTAFFQALRPAARMELACA